MTIWGLIALICFALTAHYTVPAPTKPSVPRSRATRYEGSLDPTSGNLEAHRAGKRGIGEYLAALVIWVFLVGWVWMLVRRFLH